MLEDNRGLVTKRDMITKCDVIPRLDSRPENIALVEKTLVKLK